MSPTSTALQLAKLRIPCASIVRTAGAWIRERDRRASGGLVHSESAGGRWVSREFKRWNGLGDGWRDGLGINSLRIAGKYVFRPTRALGKFINIPRRPVRQKNGWFRCGANASRSGECQTLLRRYSPNYNDACLWGRGRAMGCNGNGLHRQGSTSARAAPLAERQLHSTIRIRNFKSTFRIRVWGNTDDNHFHGGWRPSCMFNFVAWPNVPTGFKSWPATAIVNDRRRIRA